MAGQKAFVRSQARATGTTDIGINTAGFLGGPRGRAGRVARVQRAQANQRRRGVTPRAGRNMAGVANLRPGINANRTGRRMRRNAARRG